MFRRMLIVLFTVLSACLAFGQELVQDDNWVYLKGGQTAFDVDFRKDGTVYFNNKLLMSCDYMEGAGDVYISKPSPKRGFSIVKCVYDDSAYIIDTRNKQVLTKDIIPKDEALGNWVSWSPDEKYFVSVEGGEIYNIVFFVLNLENLRAKKIPIKSFRTETEMHDFQDKTFSWTTDNSFKLRVDIVCNPYESNNCTEQNQDKVIRSYNAQVNIVTSAVTYGTPKAKTTSGSLPKKSSAAGAISELRKQLLQDDESVRDCLRESYGGNESKLFQKFQFKPVHLNGDRQPEYIIEANDDSGSGMGQDGCFGDWRGNNGIWVYGKNAEGYKQLLQGLFSVSIRPLKTIANGYRNLKDAGHNGVLLIETIYKFDGNRYKAAECLTYEFVETRKGRTSTKLVGRDDCSGYPGIKSR
jgi:hypothetical protein